MKDLSSQDYCFGFSITSSKNYVFLSQQAYVEYILVKASMPSHKPFATLVDTKGKLSFNYIDPHPYTIGYKN